MAPEAAGWLRVVEQELKAVLNNVLGPEPTTQIAAYHCQQAAEKLVKTVLISAGIDPPRWHNIHDFVIVAIKAHQANENAASASPRP